MKAGKPAFGAIPPPTRLECEATILGNLTMYNKTKGSNSPVNFYFVALTDLILPTGSVN